MQLQTKCGLHNCYRICSFIPLLCGLLLSTFVFESRPGALCIARSMLIVHGPTPWLWINTIIWCLFIRVLQTALVFVSNSLTKDHTYVDGYLHEESYNLILLRFMLFKLYITKFWRNSNQLESVSIFGRDRGTNPSTHYLVDTCFCF